MAVRKLPKALAQTPENGTRRLRTCSRQASARSRKGASEAEAERLSSSKMSNHPHHDNTSYYRLDVDCDDEEMEDDLIVYGEQASVRKRHPSQETTQCSQQTTFSYKTVGMNPKHNDVDAFIISRDERRKRWRVWQRNTVLPGETVSPSFPEPDSSDAENEEHRMENTFASLQALLQESSPTSQSQEKEEDKEEDNRTLRHSQVRQEQQPPPLDTNGEGEPTMVVARDTDPISSTRAASPIARGAELSIHLDDGGDSVGPSPPDFCLNHDDDTEVCVKEVPRTAILQELDRQSRALETRHGDSLSKKARDSTSRKKRKEKEPKIRAKPSRARSSPPPTPQFEKLSSLLPPGNRKRQRRQSLGGRNAENAVNLPPSRPVTTQVTQNSKTIVGIRPTHWQRACLSRSRPAQSEPSNRLKFATLRSMHASENAAPCAKAAGAVLPRSKDLAATLRRKENSSTNQQISAKSECQGKITTQQLRKMTYHPQTMPKPRAVTEVLPSPIVQDEGNTTSSIAVTIDRPSFSSPTNNTSSRRHTRRSSRSGPWTKRLSAIKSNQTNDAMKLQHPGMNRHHGISFDLNDPRKKARWFTDVTILSDDSEHLVATPKNWGFSASAVGAASSSGGDASLLTVLGHIHQHAPTTNHNWGATGRRRESVVSKAFAWICFTHTTCRNIGLRKGMELRLYDAVLLPVGRIFTGSEVAVPRDSDKGEIDCRFLVICTQLCEKHQGKLDPVPNYTTVH